MNWFTTMLVDIYYRFITKNGKGGIRTLGNREVTSVFKTDAIDHSATFPFRQNYNCLVMQL